MVTEALAPASDSGLWALAAAAAHFQIYADRQALAYDLGLAGRSCRGVDLQRGATLIGLKARLLNGQERRRLATLSQPAILRMRDGEYVMVRPAPGRQYEVMRFETERVQLWTLDALCADWSGEIVLIARRGERESQEVGGEYGFAWFVRFFLGYRRVWSQVLLASLFMQLIALVTPLMTQVVIDKVLVHNSTSTLVLVISGLVIMGVFEATLQYLRAYALSHTAIRMGVAISGHIFRHLLRLPAAYFDRNAAGQILARLDEVDRIRDFFTGSALTSLLDICFGLLFFGVLFLYSPGLTLLVVLAIPLYLAIVVVVRPTLMSRLAQRFTRYSVVQQFVAEAVVAAQTVKAMAVEPLMEAQWAERRAALARKNFEVQSLGSLGANLVWYVSRLMTAMILYFGARSVIAGEITVGQLIAFNMIAGQLVAPILRVSQLWQELQQVQVSIARLGEIMRAPVEAGSGTMLGHTTMRGQISLRNLSFRYEPNGPEVLQDVSLEIPAGQVLGIVGPSGSGKSTLSKLVQRLYEAQHGQILIDGVDVTRVHPSWIRQQIGVVLQENLLFNRTLHENIAMAAPHVTREQVIDVARLAGADEFIARMPQGYDTVIEERGANLSGGQRQRIAIARALAGNPRILILDEATSAVDYETEAIIQRGLAEMARGRTLIVIAHRLMTVRRCDRIIGVDRGRIVEDGTHEELLRREGGMYRRLWTLQSDPG